MGFTRLRIFLAALCLIIGPAIISTAMAASDPRPNRGGLKIEVTAPGLCRISGSDISDAGVTIANIVPDTLRMFHQDKEIPILVSSAATALDTTDAIDFYARGIDNQFTGTDVYWLFWGGPEGSRMSGKNSAVSTSSADLTTFADTRTVEENHLLWPQTPGAPSADYWFWEKFTAPQSATYPFDLPSPVRNAGEANLIVYFQGVSTTDHRAAVSLNGQNIGQASWTGTDRNMLDMQVDSNLLKSSQNRLAIESTANFGSVFYFNKIAVTYTRELAASGNQLLFALTSDNPVPVRVTGFSKNLIRIFDITNPADVKRIFGMDIEADGSGFQARFEHPGGEKRYIAVTPDAYQDCDRIVFRPAFDLKKASNQADYLLITDNTLMSGLDKLCELRRRQGFAVKTVDIEDIYDVFSFGFFDPSAVRDFLEYASENWTPPAPQYVLLAGDSNLDYRDYFGTGKENIVPVMLNATPELGLTPSDNGFVAFDTNSPVPELYIGRISGDTSNVLSKTADKIIWYETDSAYVPDQLLFVADDDDLGFEELNDDLASYLPRGYTAVKVYSRLYDSLADVTNNILSFVDAGMLVTSFVGHGDVIRWGAEPYGGGQYIIEPGDVDDLKIPGNLTFLVALDCLNGYFSQSFDYSLAEEWVMAEQTGAVACFAPSGLSHPWEHEFLGQFIFDAIFNEKENRIGAICVQSKIDAYYSGASDKVLTSLNLIGDPATTLAIYRNPDDMVTVFEIAASAGPGGEISPAGSIPAFENSDETFTITPDSGYRITDVTVDGVSQGAIGSYTFSDISSGHTISASFKSQGGGGGGGGCFIAELKWRK